MKKLRESDVLRYQPGRRNQSTVKRFYLQWRAEQKQPIPIRCDVPDCIFHTKPLIWNGKELKPILDHINGVSGDNRPENLRLLCPNCNSQQQTHGGGNKGKVEQSKGGFSKINQDGKKHHVLPVETGNYEFSRNDIETNIDDKKQ